MAETLLQKAQRLGIKPSGTQATGTNSLLLKAQKAGIKPASKPVTPVAPQEQGATGLKGFGVGLLKGVGSTLTGLGQLASKGLQYLPGAAGEFFKGGAEYGQELQDTTLKATTTSQKVGKGIEQIAEFFIPAGKLAKADKALDLIIAGSKMGNKAKVATSILGKAGMEGLGAGSVTLAQTGGDFKEAGKTAVTGGVLSAGVRGAGQVIKSIKIPEKLYSRIFKTELNSLKSEYKTGTLSKLAKSDPEKYAQALESGLIKNGAIDDTLAKQALDRGLKGSLDTMATKVMEDTIDLELKAMKAVKNKKIALTGAKLKNLVATLDDVADDYMRIGSGEIGETAQAFSNIIKKGKGKISGKQLLDMRRFMDGMRYKSSYTTSNKLSLGQENTKYWSDFLRGKVNKIPGVGTIMKDYSFNIKAFDSIVKAAARNKNNNILGLLDTVMLGTGNIIPALALKGSRTAAVSTNIAQGLKALEGGLPQTISGGIRGAIADGITPQE
jgi:hypothetical protein